MMGATKISYGVSRHQTGVLHASVAASATDAPTPMVVLIHGGFWSWPYNRWLMWLLERDLRRRDWATFNIGYRRLGRCDGGADRPRTPAGKRI